jgi:hypothetical protein
MCDNCKDIILRERFYSDRDYLNCLGYIAELIDSGQFTMAEQTYSLDAVKNPNSKWVDDIIIHRIVCNFCCDIFSAFADTYHGNGSFKRED